MTPERQSLIRAELARLGEQFESADRRAKRATTIADRELAEADRQDAQGEFFAAGQELADLLLLLLRYGLRHRREALCSYLVEAMRDELEPIAETIARLENR